MRRRVVHEIVTVNTHDHGDVVDTYDVKFFQMQLLLRSSLTFFEPFIRRLFNQQSIRLQTVIGTLPGNDFEHIVLLCSV